MSQFFKILEQAERDRALRKGAPGRADHVVPSPAAAPAEDPPPSGATVSPSVSTDGVEGHLVSLLYPNSFMAEPYRVIRHAVEQLHRADQLSVVAVSSAGVGDGKTTTSINLAGALAQAPEARVLLVDADLRRPAIAHHLMLGQGTRGLVEAILEPTLGLDDVVRSLPHFNLDVLAAGTVPAAPYEILKSARLGDLLEEARRRYDFVVLDTAPLVPVPDSRLLGKLVDGMLIVVGAHKAPRKMLAEALNILDPAKVIGLVFNQDDGTRSGYYYDGYRAYGAAHNGHGSNGHRPRRWDTLWRRPRMASVVKRAKRRRSG